MKTSFILHLDSLVILEKMPDDIAGKFIKILYEYHKTGELPEMDFAMTMAVTPFVNQFVRDSKKYLNTVERNKINGLKGGRPKKPTETQKTQSVNLKPKKADSDKDNDKESDSNNEKENIKEINFKKLTLEDFRNEISKHKTSVNLNQEDLKSFYDYWRELTPSGKMKFQIEKSWQTDLRLKNWERNKSKFGNKQIDNPQPEKFKSPNRAL